MKWQADALLQQKISEWSIPLRDKVTHYAMDAVYYDTVDHDLSAQHAGLRIRKENGRSVCCLKCGGSVQTNGLHSREEYECEAQTIDEGIAGLRAAGAPIEICDLIAQKPLLTICRITFTRTAILLCQKNTDGNVCMTAELALDTGTLSHLQTTAPLCEIELEQKSGDIEAFLALANSLAQTFNLKPEPRSKLARAIAL